MYAPGSDGTLRLAAVEYNVVVKQARDARHRRGPKLLGHRFDVTGAPNRFGLPAFYSLHVSAQKHNPAGTFSMWNPRVLLSPVRIPWSRAGLAGPAPVPV